MEKLLPQLRFPGFEGEWEEKKLGEVFSIFNGYAFPSKSSEMEGTLWVKIADVGIQEMKQTNLSFLPNSYTKSHKKFILKKGDYVVALTRPILNRKLKIAQINDFFDGALLNQRVGKIDSKNSNSFVYSLLQRDELIKSIENNIAGSDPPNLSPNEINSILLNIPSLPEQTKIATFLTEVDKKLTALKQKKTLLEQYKKGVMQQIFSQQLRFKDDNGNDFPDWEEKKLGEISNEVKRDLKDKTDLSNIEVLTISSEKGFITQKERFSQVIAGNSLTKYTLLKKGQMSYNRGASKRFQFGCFNTLKLYEEALVPNIYISFYFSENCIGEFYDQLFSTGFANNQLRKFISSSVRLDGLLNINRGDFFSLSVPVPSLREQSKIANFLSAIDEKINHCQGQIEKMQVWKKGLLQQLFV